MIEYEGPEIFWFAKPTLHQRHLGTGALFMRGQGSTGRRYQLLANTLLVAMGEKTTQKEVAENLIVTQPVVSQWCSGTTRPSPKNLGELTRFLQLNPTRMAELAEYDDNPDALSMVRASYERAKKLFP